MSVVWVRQSGARFRVDDAVQLPALRARREERLGLLSVVLRTWIRRRVDAQLPGQAVSGPLQQQAMPRPIDSVHALLSLVSHESTPCLETPGQPAFL